MGQAATPVRSRAHPGSIVTGTPGLGPAFRAAAHPATRASWVSLVRGSSDSGTLSCSICQKVCPNAQAPLEWSPLRTREARSSPIPEREALGGGTRLRFGGRERQGGALG